jgi:H+/gluconate symporter-like permease
MDADLYGGTGRFIINFFRLFLLGSVFGKLMDDRGAALSFPIRLRWMIP